MEVNGSCVDDLLRARMDKWQTHSDVTFERFETTRALQASFKFTGMHISESDSRYHIDHDFFMSRVEQAPSNANFSNFVSMRMRLTWIENT